MRPDGCTDGLFVYVDDTGGSPYYATYKQITPRPEKVGGTHA
jgi:hypothetical protein